MEVVPQFVLETLHGPETHTLQLTGDTPVTIGRGSENTLPLPSGATVSRVHSQLTKYDSTTDQFWKLEDMGSKHGTFLNGIKLKEGQGVRLRSGDLITIEPFTFQVVDNNEDNKFTETFDDARTLAALQSYALTERRVVLDLHTNDCKHSLNVAEPYILQKMNLGWQKLLQQQRASQLRLVMLR